MLFHKNKGYSASIEQMESELSYTAHVSKAEKKDIECIFARLFSSEDGKKALAYLQYITFWRSVGVTASNEQLRYIEGQRSLINIIRKLIEQGKSG